MRDQEIIGLYEAYQQVHSQPQEEVEALDEDKKYDANRRRAAQRAAARNEARRQGKTGSVPGVGYVTPRPERETYTDSAGVVRHTSGARMPKNEEVETDLFDYILEHLVAEGYADTNDAALAIMANMSEEWREDIVEGKKEFPHKKVDRQVYDAMDSGETAGDSGNRAKEKRDYARAEKMRSVAAKHGGKTRA